jgi:hypothetical protein
MWEMRNAHKILIGKSEWKKQLGSPGSRWEENVKMDVSKIWWECVDWIHLAQDEVHWLAL